MRLALADIARASEARVAPAPAERWVLASLTGRLVELSGGSCPAPLTTAFGLVVEAQLSGDRAAWITLTSSAFFPPDAAEGGVDLRTLVVVRVPAAVGASRVADYLVRSGGFGLVVLDLAEPAGDRLRIPIPVLTRLLSLARTHETAILVLTRKSGEADSINSLISLRAEAQAVREDAGFRVLVRALKDKRGGPGWTHAETCRGSVGVR